MRTSLHVLLCGTAGVVALRSLSARMMLSPFFEPSCSGLYWNESSHFGVLTPGMYFDRIVDSLDTPPLFAVMLASTSAGTEPSCERIDLRRFTFFIPFG